ncbi:MAG: isoprenylcysteine carboxylmethyltransferase family protein [Anaerolineales bacterium]|nr:isoprenylcysteine carboxylmethyltransferase family protein [Anaerolineales bacterium]
MKFKGMDTLSKHVPELNSAGGMARIAVYAIFLFAFVTAYFIITDKIPTWSIDSQILIIALGFLVMSLFFSRKQLYKEKYKELAYRNAFAHYALPGLALIMAAIAHAGYMNGPFVPQGWWTIIFLALGWFMLCIGAILWIRSVFAFGADNLALLYVYYPEEGRIINSSIYGILRHPVYAGVLRVGIGLALLNGNANAIAFAILMPLGLSSWIRLVEEKELIERFGQSYLDYRKRTPAFWPRLPDFGVFFKFLITGI